MVVLVKFQIEIRFSTELHGNSKLSMTSSVAYPGWHTPGVQTEDGVLAPLGGGVGGSMLEVIISFSDNVIGTRLLKIALTLN